jgi:hypothetical protein
MQEEEIKKYDKIIRYGFKFYASFFALIFIAALTNTDNNYLLLNEFVVTTAIIFIFFETIILFINFLNANRVKNKKIEILSLILFFLTIILFLLMCLFYLHFLFGLFLLLMFYWALRVFVPNFKIRVIFYLFLLIWSFILQDYHTKLFYGITGNIVKKEFTKKLNSLELTNSADLVCEEEIPDNCKFIRAESIKFKTSEDWGSPSNWDIICSYGCPK